MSFLSRHFPKQKYPYCTMVIVAAGSSQRMGEDKQFLDLGGLPVLAHSLKTFETLPCIHEIIVVTRQERVLDAAAICRDYGICKVSKILVGGAARQESALAGVSEANPLAELIGIHDGARPFATAALTERAVRDARFYQAVAPAVAVRDTVKRVEAQTVVDTPSRDGIMAVQTPQVFRAELIKGALTYAVEQGISITDDCSAVEAIGGKVHLIPGEEANIKLTTPLDMELANAILREREAVS